MYIACDVFIKLHFSFLTEQGNISRNKIILRIFLFNNAVIHPTGRNKLPAENISPKLFWNVYVFFFVNLDLILLFCIPPGWNKYLLAV
jgi:hypothetical protein